MKSNDRIFSAMGIDRQKLSNEIDDQSKKRGKLWDTIHEKYKKMTLQ